MSSIAIPTIITDTKDLSVNYVARSFCQIVAKYDEDKRSKNYLREIRWITDQQAIYDELLIVFSATLLLGGLPLGPNVVDTNNTIGSRETSTPSRLPSSNVKSNQVKGAVSSPRNTSIKTVSGAVNTENTIGKQRSKEVIASSGLPNRVNTNNTSNHSKNAALFRNYDQVCQGARLLTDALMKTDNKTYSYMVNELTITITSDKANDQKVCD